MAKNRKRSNTSSETSTTRQAQDQFGTVADLGQATDSQAQEATNMSENTQTGETVTVEFKKRNVEKSGNIAYARDGVRASIYFNKNIFAGGAQPESIVMTFPAGVLAEPGATVVRASSPEAQAKVKALAEKAQAAAAKAVARAEKALKRAAKAGVAVEPIAEPVAEATTETTEG